MLQRDFGDFCLYPVLSATPQAPDMPGKMPNPETMKFLERTAASVQRFQSQRARLQRVHPGIF